MIFIIPPQWVTVLDFVAWFVISLGVGYYYQTRPNERFRTDDWLTRMRGFENEGNFYRNVLGIMKWKRFLPDGSALTGRGFRKTHLQSTDNDYFVQFLMESRRAEWTHFVALWFIPVFLIWNTIPDEVAVIVYAVVFNLPCMITQRFNRIRFRRVLQHRQVTID